MTLHPIPRALLTLKKCNVQCLLMGGQACIVYGAAEFSRDLDVAILASVENLAALRAALAELKAEPIFFPPLDLQHLDRGHACHFRCHAAGSEGLRLDVMARLRGCEPFPRLWDRRFVVALPGIGEVALLSLRDLVQCKKTQRDKDWVMLRRLVEIDYVAGRRSGSSADVRWWLAELRSPSYLLELAQAFPGDVAAVATRPGLAEALQRGAEALEESLRAEELLVRQEDRAYWRPLRAELEAMRLARG